VHNWREPKAKRLEKKRRKICWMHLIQRCIQGAARSSFTSSSVIRESGSGAGARKSGMARAIGVTKVLLSIGKCSFDSGPDKAHPGFEFAAGAWQHAIMDGKFKNLFVQR
jgi:hypothetical protein